MRRDHADLYALCRHDPEADAYFQALPEDVRSQLSARMKQINTLSAGPSGHLPPCGGKVEAVEKVAPRKISHGGKV